LSQVNEQLTANAPPPPAYI